MLGKVKHMLPFKNLKMTPRRNRFLFFTGFTTAGAYVFYQGRKSDSEIVRMGFAGCLAILTCELTMHTLDTLNLRSKVYQDTSGPHATKLQRTTSFMRASYHLVQKQGPIVLFRGITSIYYGYAIAGVAYFMIYKKIKNVMFGNFPQLEKNYSYLVYFFASFAAEISCLMFYYPFVLIKSRMQTSNEKFMYEGVTNAYKKILVDDKLHGASLATQMKNIQPKNMYCGLSCYFLEYTAYIALQYTFYESFTEYYLAQHKKRAAEKSVRGFNEYEIETKTEEDKLRMTRGEITFASFLSGGLAGFLTNTFDCVAVNKQADPSLSIIDYLKKNWKESLTKGIMVRSIYYGIQSVIFFNVLEQYSRIYNVTLQEE